MDWQRSINILAVLLAMAVLFGQTKAAEPNKTTVKLDPGHGADSPLLWWYRECHATRESETVVQIPHNDLRKVVTVREWLEEVG